MIQKIIYKTKDYNRLKFTINPENAETVVILGLNEDWQNAIPMRKRKDGHFVAEVNLNKGTTHEFKYLVNNTTWLNESDADSEKQNIYGGMNSVVSI